MSNFVPWNSQDLDTWASTHARGAFIELDGHKTHYVEKGEGEPVILLHGFNLDWHTWMTNIDAISDRNKVYAFDFWSSGFSTRNPLDYGYDIFGRQLQLFMDHFELEKVAIVGHSMGGGTAIVFSEHNPSRVTKLVLLDSVGIEHALPLRARLFQLPLLPEFLFSLNSNWVRRKNLADFWLHRQELLTDEVFEKFCLFQKVSGTTELLLTILRKNFFNTLNETIRDLSQHSIPTLIIWGEQDGTVPLDSGRMMHQILAGSRLEILDNAGHLANFDQADQFNALVLDFLENN